jgi:hypothetical protein
MRKTDEFDWFLFAILLFALAMAGVFGYVWKCVEPVLSAGHLR